MVIFKYGQHRPSDERDLMAASEEAYGEGHPATYDNPEKKPMPGHFYEGSEEAGQAKGPVWVHDRPQRRDEDNSGGRWDG